MTFHKTALVVCILITNGNILYESGQVEAFFLSNSDISYNFFTDGSNFIKANSKCLTQLELIETGIERKAVWALKFIDAWAKLPAGLFYGHNTEMGNFDECLSINERLTENEQIKGKYCLTHIESTKGDNAALKSDLYNMSLELGICMPATCSAKEAEILLKQIFEKTWNIALTNETITINENSCTQRDRGPLKTLDWLAIAILMLLGILMLLSTTYDYYRTSQEKQLNPLLNSFSLRSNIRQLFRMTTPTNTPKHIIPALNGIRCLSIIYIIFLHSYMMLVLSPNVNGADIDPWHQTWFYMIWKNGAYAVDSFFFLSGLLLISVAFRDMERNSGALNIPKMYLHRFIRLSPVLYLAVLLFMTLYRFTGNGPIWNNFISSYHLCDQTWWATLLYVQNYAAPGRMCLGHSWYLAVDMQLYLLSPIALILIWKWKRWGLATLLFIGLLLVACLFSVILLNDLIVFSVTNDPGSDSAEMRQTYYATHARVSPWIIGIIFGYYLHTHNGRRVLVSKRLVIAGWVLSMGLFLTVIFALQAKTRPEANIITPLEGAFFLSLSRVAWPVGLCWLVFACVNGYAGPVNDFLSWSLWQPLSKLSYCMYIWHFLIVTINAGQIKTNAHFSFYDAMLRFWSDFGITILFSTIMYLGIEAPMLGVEKFLLSKATATSKENKHVQQPATTISQQNLCE